MAGSFTASVSLLAVDTFLISRTSRSVKKIGGQDSQNHRSADDSTGSDSADNLKLVPDIAHSYRSNYIGRCRASWGEPERGDQAFYETSENLTSFMRPYVSCIAQSMGSYVLTRPRSS